MWGAVLLLAAPLGDDSSSPSDEHDPDFLEYAACVFMFVFSVCILYGYL